LNSAAAVMLPCSQGPAHHHHLIDAASNGGALNQRHGQIGQRAEGGQGNRGRSGGELVD
jgi:hypothetical protein